MIDRHQISLEKTLRKHHDLAEVIILQHEILTVCFVRLFALGSSNLDRCFWQFSRFSRLRQDTIRMNHE
jgi:hypothetical protein